MRALWIEMPVICFQSFTYKSRPVRALWIEINIPCYPSMPSFVEAREGLVD